jgi:hypothetical protein
MTFPIAFTLFLGAFVIAATIHTIVQESNDLVVRRIMGTYFKKFRRRRLKQA